ncbi:PhaM family polyhydroxyalkanoate granule multifunctional regulatory protein [Alcaligenes endophyticus]|uniref:Transcriptional regulator n=1 Tax=Alcaligenes endophyticus TaxID=1929088 RepID=A0ABT8EFF2_9BURK|nr:PhaM family polyhydroxyalkanoate granule multifunctional regulatory protein [Alcaligenes endophyticus]MCX5590324.1 hypothetical protein [Alcaligenes endophyticus]MDN4120012.1 hypothetical protein [Alcaligenes endophyticus]
MNTNPFNLPNFAALGDPNENPLLRSMDMMSQAWRNMATGGSADMGAAVMGQLDPDELDRRIRDMRAVESWLQLNLSMLSATIQGLEIQRSTLNTLHELVRSTGQKNPFEGFLAAQPTKSTADASETSSAASASAPTVSDSGTTHDASAAMAEESAKALAEAGAAAKGWWNMLQQQFESLTAASLKQAEALRPAAPQAVSPDTTLGARQSPFSGTAATSAATAPVKASTPSPRKGVSKTAKTAAKKAAKTAPARKTAAKSVAPARPSGTTK